MEIVDLLNRLATERLIREIRQRAHSSIINPRQAAAVDELMAYTCGDTEILAMAIEVQS